MVVSAQHRATEVGVNILKQGGNAVDAAVAAGRLTKAQGGGMKQRIEAGGFPLFGMGAGPGFEHHEMFGGLDAAAAYLGLTGDELQTQLASGKSLADIAKSKGKSVDGLVDARKRGVSVRVLLDGIGSG